MMVVHNECDYQADTEVGVTTCLWVFYMVRLRSACPQLSTCTDICEVYSVSVRRLLKRLVSEIHLL